MKTILYGLLLLIAGYGCNSVSGNKKITEDSLRYYPPTPGKISQEQFRFYYRELSSFFDSTLLHSSFNGAILIARDGDVLYEKYNGFRDLRKKDPITDSTVFQIASTSKTFTATAILQLVQQKKLSLDDSLSRFFPGFAYPGITVKMLLDHRSGLPNYLYFITADNWDMKKYLNNNDVLRMMDSLRPARTYPPDTHYSYCNTNFVLLALIVEKISGIPFPAYMQQHFFDPLQMNHTHIFTMADSLHETPSFNYNGTAWQNDCFEGTYGDKNVYTTARDLLKWDQALYTNEIINQSMLDAAFTPYSFEKKSMHNYGLGWHLQLFPNGKKIIYHFGRWHGFNAAFARLTDEKATIIILGNKFNRNIYSTAHRACSLFGDYGHKPVGDEEETDNKQ